MTVRYVDKDNVVQEIVSVTAVKPFGTLQVVVETATTNTPVNFSAVIEILDSTP